MAVCSTVQPRGYGEHVTILSCASVSAGSAPWIRGTLAYNRGYNVGSRFSPVDTGNTATNHSALLRFSGSAPWIRGTLASRHDHKNKARFSPVDTGNTSAQ